MIKRVVVLKEMYIILFHALDENDCSVEMFKKRLDVDTFLKEEVS